MATTNKFRKIQQIASTSVVNAYQVDLNVTSSISVVSFTNTTTTPIVIDIYHDDGTNNLLKKTIQLPGGVGQERIYYGLERNVFESEDILKVQANSAAAFNLFIHGSETSA
jgi:hypothetical protein